MNLILASFCGMSLDIDKLTKILARVASCRRLIPENRSIIRPEVIEGSIHDDVFSESVVEYPRNLSTKSHAVRWVQPDYIPLHSLHLTWRERCFLQFWALKFNCYLDLLWLQDWIQAMFQCSEVNLTTIRPGTGNDFKVKEKPYNEGTSEIGTDRAWFEGGKTCRKHKAPE